MSVRPLARGSALGLATLVIEKGSALVLVVALARTLGPDDYGRYSFVVAYLTLFQVLADLGLEPILLRRLTQAPSERERWMANALALRIGLALVSAGLAVAAVGVAAPDGGVLRLWVAFGAAGLLFVSQPGFRALLRAEMRLDTVLTVAVATSLLLLSLVGGALWLGTGLTGVFVGIAAAHLAGFGMAGWAARRSFRFRLAFEWDVWRSLAAEAWPVGANVFVVMIGLRIAPLLLMSYRGPVEVGYLASAMRLAEALNLLADGLMLAVFPVLARLAVESPQGLREVSAVCAKLLAGAMLAVALAASALSADVLGLLFGDDFRAAGPALAVLSWFALLASVGTLYANLLVAVGRQQVLFFLNAVSAFFQIGLQFVLVARYGLLGAACGATLASALNHVALYFLPASRQWMRPCVHAFLPLIALAGGLLWIGSRVGGPPLIRAVGLVVAFHGLAWVMGLAGRADVDRLRRALSAD